MASFSRLWLLTLFLVTVLRASCVASSHHSCDRSQVSDDLGSLPATRKLPDCTSIGEKSSANGGPWCLPHEGVPDPQLQGNMDYACGHGADCGPIQPGGSCYDPNTVWSHASYAMNSYFQANGKDPTSCDFGGTGTMTNSDPSYANCNYSG